MKTVRTTTAALAATVALGAVPSLAADERNARAEGAPGYYCKQAGKQADPQFGPGSPEYRTCVRLAAQGRRQAEHGDKRGGNPNARARGASGRFCQADRPEGEGADPGSKAFRLCVRKAAQARSAARS